MPSHEMPRRSSTILTITLVLLAALSTQAKAEPPHTEAPKLEVPATLGPAMPAMVARPVIRSTTSPVVLGSAHEFTSEVLGEQRIVNVLLPPGYHEESQAEAFYPVIYLLDGAVDEDYHHVSGLVQFLTAYQLMPPSILVGIANVDRYRDFSHETRGKRYLERIPTAGGSADFIRFLGEEIQPFVETNFRASGPRTLIGQSMGGLVASEIFFRQPELFDQYFIVSPSLWWDDSSLIESAEAAMKATPERSGMLVLSLGSEGEEMQQGVDLFVKALEAHAPEALKWRYVPLPEETHATILHRALYRSFEIVYGESHPGL